MDNFIFVKRNLLFFQKIPLQMFDRILNMQLHFRHPHKFHKFWNFFVKMRMQKKWVKLPTIKKPVYLLTMQVS